MQYITFPIGEKRIMNVWMDDILQSNINFLKMIDSEYFQYLSETFREELLGEKKNQAAMALRAACYQGLESLYSLIGALVQAPGAVAAWIPNCTTGELRKVIRAIHKGDVSIRVYNIHTELSWVGISRLVHGDMQVPENTPQPISYFAKLWSILAEEFLHNAYQAEYNSIKHGFRVAHGGWKNIQWKGDDGSEQNFSGGDFGSRFYTTEHVNGAIKQHHVLCHEGVNWDPEIIANKLELISVSIRNIVAYLLQISGYTDGVTKQYVLDEDMHENVLDFQTNLLFASMKPTVYPEMCREITIDFLNGRLDEVYRVAGGFENT